MLMIILSLQIEEEESFELLCHLMYDLGLRKLYKPNMAGLQVSMYQLARLMRYDNVIPLSLSYFIIEIDSVNVVFFTFFSLYVGLLTV
mgnify:CR=1 FL=1